MKIAFTLTGTQAIIFHADDIDAADTLTAWRQDPDNKNKSKAGDDRTPPWTWATYVYLDESGFITWPFANLSKGLTTAATRVVIPGGKSGKTFKELAAGAILINEQFLEFRTANPKTGKLEKIPFDKFNVARDENFTTQRKLAQANGFDLMQKRCKIGQAKHIRVRPVFPRGWTISGTLTVQTKDITFDHVVTFFEIAGKGGQGDWRPWSPKSPGPFGQFRSDLKLM
jgi:hypothetical protein